MKSKIVLIPMERAVAYARAPQVDLSGPLGGVKDWYMVDATTVRVRDALREEFPGTGGYAAIKVQKVLSVGCGAPVRYHFSPAREHDSRPLTIDESWRGYGLLADLGSASIERLRACEAHRVHCVIRLTDNWKPKVDSIARGQVTQTFFPGTNLDALLAEDILMRDGRAIDADVHVGGDKHPLPLRLIGVHTPQGYGFFLTNLPPRIGPRQVADLYRVRCEVERSIRLDKSVHRLDEVDSEQPCSVKTLLHASPSWHTHTICRPVRRRPGRHAWKRRFTLDVWLCSWPCRVSLSPKPSTSRGPRPRSAGTRSQHSSRTLVKIPTGAVARRS